MPFENDHILIRRFKEGDRSSFEELVHKYHGRIYNLCRYMLNNSKDAEDATQDSFLKSFRNFEKFDPAFPFSTWLYRIAVNTCIDYRRKPFFLSFLKKSKEGEESEYDHPSALPSPEKSYESKELGLQIDAGLRSLSPKLRAAIVLKEVEGLSYEEIAGVLDVSIGTVKSRISRAREELKKNLAGFREQK